MSIGMLVTLLITYILLVVSKNDLPQGVSSSPVMAPTERPDLNLESVIMLSRHGNRAPNEIVNTHLCPHARTKANEMYASQNVADGSLTYSGLHGMWNLGQFTSDRYGKSSFMPSSFTKTAVKVTAAAGTRTLISAAAWAQTAFPEHYGHGLNIPAPVFSSPEEVDNLLEVRNAACASLLKRHVAEFDEGPAVELLQAAEDVVAPIARACGLNVSAVAELTEGESTPLQAVKDVADALTGDMLEGFPLPDHVTADQRASFLSFAERAFVQRHFRADSSMPAYLSGSFPRRLARLFDRRVQVNEEDALFRDHPDAALTAQIKADRDAGRAQALPPQRRLFAYHAHRELLYALAEFMQMPLSVDRPGVQEGLIHPSTGVFFELWRDPSVASDILKKCVKDSVAPALDANRRKKLAYKANAADDAYFVRVLLWVPCWDADGRSAAYGGDGSCGARVAVLGECGEEFCPYKQVKGLIARGFERAGGDFKRLCREEPVSTAPVVQLPRYTEEAGNWVKVAAGMR